MDYSTHKLKHTHTHTHTHTHLFGHVGDLLRDHSVQAVGHAVDLLHSKVHSLLNVCKLCWFIASQQMGLHSWHRMFKTDDRGSRWASFLAWFSRIASASIVAGNTCTCFTALLKKIETN